MQASLLNTFRIGDWTVEPMHSRIAGLRGTHHVEPRAMDVLVALAQRAGDTVGRDELIAAMWKHTQATDESDAGPAGHIADVVDAFQVVASPVTEIARELDVSTIVQRSVLCSPSELQAFVQLIDVAADAHLFSRSHVRALADVLRVQNEIASTIARDVGMTLKSRGAVCRCPSQTSLPGAYAPDALRTRLSSDLPASLLREDRIPIEVEPDMV